ncbi:MULTISPECIES: hypothetical protein [Aeribacillus]|jgi:uncharacterized membrane protein|uniref:hypothetical protein n=1 Tax=Aeribacillus composti TaxID=1868734 RepID=UPI002E2434B1|nr:hypothetical protein [Aeribacillus composti]
MVSSWIKEHAYMGDIDSLLVSRTRIFGVSCPTVHGLGVQQPSIVLIDSTALRSSLYDSQAKWGMSTRYRFV